ncbi:MAG: cupin domain-containing protein [Clostridiales bacterium]|jgi:transcriptional regulator with XRE-family HTH domain|nr:cupin domain-containing protein [Clostridiales bacterium]
MNQNLAIGTKIKYLRSQKNLTLKQLSEMTDLSTGFLSQLERGMSTIAIDSLYKVSKSLGVELSSFFQPEDEPLGGPMMRNFEQRHIQVSPRIVESILSREVMNYDYLPKLFQLMPNGSSSEPPAMMYSHEGEEFLYVLEGALTLYLGDIEYTLYPGDSAQLHSSEEHNWANRTNYIVRFLQINYPNPYRTKNI